MPKFVVSKHHMMIGCDRLYVSKHMQNTWVILNDPSMYTHGLGTLEAERSNMSHIVDMINIEMFTIDDYPISRDDPTWFS